MTSSRRVNLGAILLAIITIPIALITLFALAPLPVLPDLSGLGDGAIQIVTVVGAVAVIIGVLNLLAVHLRKLFAQTSIYSGITLLTFGLVLAVHALEVRGIL